MNIATEMGTFDIALDDRVRVAAGCSKKPFSKAAASEAPEAYPLRYVENLNDARTMLAGFFSIRQTLLRRY